MVIGHQQAVPLLFESRLLYYRERGAHAYGPFPFWISSWFLELPQVLINTLIFSLIMYNMAGLRTSEGAYGFFWGVMVLTSTAGLFMAQFIAALAPTAEIAIGKIIIRS